MAKRTFKINVTVEHGQLREYLASPDDRMEMIARLDAALTQTTDLELRNGVIQILNDQLVDDNAHEPLIIIVDPAASPGNEEVIEWVSEIVETPTKKRDIKVKIDKYRHTNRTQRKPGKPDKPFKLPKDDGETVPSGDQDDDKEGVLNQKFYKFEIKAKTTNGQDLVLDPCIICVR